MAIWIPLTQSGPAVCCSRFIHRELYRVQRINTRFLNCVVPSRAARSMNRRRVGTYRGYSPGERADDLRHAAPGGVQHAVGAGLKQQDAGQVEDQRRIFCLLQLLGESLAVQEQRLSG